MEAQVVARAYRMGAMGPVFVEELMAKDSVEEVMIQMNEKHGLGLKAPLDKKDKHAKLHLLLKSAKLIRPEKELSIKKRKLLGNGEIQLTDGPQNDDDTSIKQKAKAVRVRFKD